MAAVAGAAASDCLIASLDYPERSWPHSVGHGGLAQAAGWILLGLFVAGPLILGKQRWLKRRVQQWDFAEQLWFWIPCAWVTLVVISRTLPENPILIVVALGAFFVAPPVMLIAGSYWMWQTWRSRTVRWTTAVGSCITVAAGLWAVAELLSNPIVL